MFAIELSGRIDTRTYNGDGTVNSGYPPFQMILDSRYSNKSDANDSRARILVANPSSRDYCKVVEV